MSNWHRRLKRLFADRRGSASVEFVFGALFVVILLVGFLEIGRAIHYYQTLSDGVRAGGRYLTRVQNPCTDAAIEDALGLVITRSSEWTNPPIFTDWPSTPSGGGGSYNFALGPRMEVSVDGCTGGVLDPENVIMLAVRYRYQDYMNLLAFLGLEDGFWIAGRHEEMHIGL